MKDFNNKTRTLYKEDLPAKERVQSYKRRLLID